MPSDTREAQGTTSGASLAAAILKEALAKRGLQLSGEELEQAIKTEMGEPGVKGDCGFFCKSCTVCTNIL
jgi:hypothetical protein